MIGLLLRVLLIAHSEQRFSKSAFFVKRRPQSSCLLRCRSTSRLLLFQATIRSVAPRNGKDCGSVLNSTIYPGRRLTDYAILGDDVVIADESVAAMYSANLSRLGVEISVATSLTSRTGASSLRNSDYIDVKWMSVLFLH